MDDKNKNRNPSVSKLIKRHILLCIPLFLMSIRLYVLVSIYIVLTSVYFILENWQTIKNNIKSFFTEIRKIKKLEYYHITDDDKLIDLEKRRTAFSLLSDMTLGTLCIITVNFIAIYIHIRQFLKGSSALNLITTIVIILMALIGAGGMIVGVVSKYTTTIYVLIPVVSALIYFLSIDPLIAFFPDFVRFAGYLFITIIFYSILAFAFPVHILRKLNSKTVLISSVTTILATFFSPIWEFYFFKHMQGGNYLLTIEDVKKATDIQDALKNIILDDSKLIDIINYLFIREESNKVTSVISLMITALTISYIVGGLMINRKISKNKSKAKFIYRTLIREKSLTDYNTLVKCSFHGGEEYENLLLNNDITQKVIKENELELVIPDVSRKTRFIAWWKRKLRTYKNYEEIKRIFIYKDTD